MRLFKPISQRFSSSIVLPVFTIVWPFIKQRSIKRIPWVPEYSNCRHSVSEHHLPLHMPTCLLQPTDWFCACLPACLCLYHWGHRLFRCLASLYISLEPDLSRWKPCPGPRSKQQGSWSRNRSSGGGLGITENHYLRPMLSCVLNPTGHVLENRIYTQNLVSQLALLLKSSIGYSTQLANNFQVVSCV